MTDLLRPDVRFRIERNGGVHQDTRKGKRRYWIDLG